MKLNENRARVKCMWRVFVKEAKTRVRQWEKHVFDVRMAVLRYRAFMAWAGLSLHCGKRPADKEQNKSSTAATVNQSDDSG